MEKTNFEKLRVYKLAENLADRIWDVVLKWDYLAQDTVGKQMIRAADSTRKEPAGGHCETTARFIRMARGSLYETQHWLRRAYKRALLSKQQVESIKPIISELSPTLNAYFRSVNQAAVDQTKRSTKYKVQSSKA